MNKITSEVEQALRAAQAAEEASFWACPDPEWQAAFQAAWLHEMFGFTCAIGAESQLLWGE